MQGCTSARDTSAVHHSTNHETTGHEERHVSRRDRWVGLSAESAAAAVARQPLVGSRRGERLRAAACPSSIVSLAEATPVQAGTMQTVAAASLGSHPSLHCRHPGNNRTQPQRLATTTKQQSWQGRQYRHADVTQEPKGEHRQRCSRVYSAGIALPGPIVEAVSHGIPDGAASLWGALAAFLTSNQAVFFATISASFKLFVMIAAISWMVSTDRLPRETASVLSKVGFNLIIPCMLMTKLGATLSVGASWALIGIPIAAFLQICAGAFLGWLAAFFVEGNYSDDIRIMGYHPQNPSRAAVAIAASTAAAMSLPQLAPQLVPKAKEAPRGSREMVQLTCAFGNSVTLPLVFLYALLPAASSDAAVAFLALFLAGWSPCLWSIGYEIVGKIGVSDSTARDANESDRQSSSSQSTSDYTGAAADATIDVTDSNSAPPKIPRVVAPGPLEVVRTYAVKLYQRFINPPLIGIILGLLFGLCPLGAFLLHPTSPSVQASLASFPAGARLFVGLGQSAMDVAVMLGGATLAIQAIVLAASLRPPAKRQLITRSVQGGANDGLLTRRPRKWYSFLIPRDPVEQRTVIAVSVVRMLFMPLIGIAIVTGLAHIGALPNDPICKFSVLLQSVMPTAQNLVLLVNLREETQPLASDLAVLLLRLYIISIIPITLWVPVLMSVAGIGPSAMAVTMA